MSTNRLSLALSTLLVGAIVSGCTEGSVGDKRACHNGAESLANGCVCTSGFYGADCASACDCQNGATCDDGVSGGGLCTCVADFYGTDCASACDCQNGATCDDGVSGGGLCTCVAGFYGADCASACDCQNGATCDDGVSGGGLCTCAAGFYGADCASACDCQNGATCDDGVSGGGACTCAASFYGADCASACDCQNGATCDDGVSGSGACACVAGYYGLGCAGVCDCPTGINCHECSVYAPSIVVPSTDSGRYWAHLEAQKVLDASAGLVWFEVKPSSIGGWTWVTKTPPTTMGAEVIDAWVSGLAPGTSHDYRVCNDDGSAEPSADAISCSEILSFTTTAPTAMPFVQVDPLDPKKLALEGGGRFTPWGNNYVDVDALNSENMLIEDAMYDDAGLALIAADFDQMNNIAPNAGLNVIRVHLRMHSFLLDPTTPNREALARFANVVEMAEDRGLYLMVTGLSYFFPADNPSWLAEQTTQEAHWTSQEIWWRNVSGALRHSAGVFAYDLVNEPYAGSGSRVVDGLYHLHNDAGPSEYCDYGGNPTTGVHGICFGQWITPDGGGETGEAIAAEWTRRMTQAIRYVGYFVNDGKHLITIGVGGAFNMNSPFFSSAEVQEYLDFISPHLYPSGTDNGQSKINLAETLSAYGKPVIVGETFTLGPADRLLSHTCNADTAQGWIGQYDGRKLGDTCPANRDPLHCYFYDAWYTILGDNGPTILAGGCPDLIP